MDKRYARSAHWISSKRTSAAAQYRGLDWSQEYDLAINGDPNDTQTAL